MATHTIQVCDAWTRFLRAINSPATVTVYSNSLHYFMRFLNLYEQEEKTVKKKAGGFRTIRVYRYYPEKLLDGTDAVKEDNIKRFVDDLKNQGRSRALIRIRVAAIRLFYRKNKVKGIDWDDIVSEIPKTRRRKDRAYFIDELHKGVNMAEPREKAAILLLASSGMRIGALPDLKVGNLHPIEKYGIYKIVVYEGYDEEYFTFCTPEAKNALDTYLEYRRKVGNEKITPMSPLFRRDFDPAKFESIKPATSVGLRYAIQKVMLAAGVREKMTLTVGQSSSQVQHAMKAVHGMRKFFDTQMTLAGVNPLWVEILEGHDIKLKESYFRPTEKDLLEGNERMLGYVHAINALTIDEANRLKVRLEKVTQEKSEIEKKFEKTEERWSKRVQDFERRLQAKGL